MPKQEIPMTKEGHQSLQKELDHLVKFERDAISKAIAEARALGDLKENSEYHAAKEKQGHLEGRIMEIQGKLASANVVDTSLLDLEHIVFGAKVTLFDIEKEKSVTYHIVGEDEADSSKGKISFKSPVAKALMGKEEGDTVIVKAPKGDIEYEIESVAY